MAALFPGSRADAPRLKVDVNFMKFISSEKDWGAQRRYSMHSDATFKSHSCARTMPQTRR